MKKRKIIDKSQALEQKLQTYPAIYVEGITASGKTVAVQTLLEHHPEVNAVVIDLKSMRTEDLSGMLTDVESHLSQPDGGPAWVVFDNLSSAMDSFFYSEVSRLVSNLSNDNRIILVGREKLPSALLELLWKGYLELIPQRHLRLTPAETMQLVEAAGSTLKGLELYHITDGWAGSVDMLIRKSLGIVGTISLEKLYKTSEYRTYIQREIFLELASDEQYLLWLGCWIPWISARMCDEIWNISYTTELLESMERKGIFVYDERKHAYRPIKMFAGLMEMHTKPTEEERLQIGSWYEQHGYIHEGLICYKEMENQWHYYDCIIRNYAAVPFVHVSYSEVMEWTDRTPEICYLRGMYYHAHQNLTGLHEEMKKIKKQDGPNVKEILLNLAYADPDVSLEEWMQMLETETNNRKEKFRLYHMLGDSFSFLCGLRDLTELFACSKREENRKANIWKSCLGRLEWMGYLLARIEYYLEKERKEEIYQEDRALFQISSIGKPYGIYEDQYNLAGLNLFGRFSYLQDSQEYENKFQRIRNKILSRGTVDAIRKAEAVANQYAIIYERADELTMWLRQSELVMNDPMVPRSYMHILCMARGYMNLNQYEKADKILSSLIPYMEMYHKWYDLADAYFMKAVVCTALKRSGQVLQNMIQSFMISGKYRYVDIYTKYGKYGIDALEEYIKWYQMNWPEGWSKKKKYQYGNVLNMPMTDYLSTVMRHARKQYRQNRNMQKDQMQEQLTMMELLVLQNLGKGLSNNEICELLNLKLPTVKTHIYNLYKKLGVDSRVQATIKGKELGIIH